MFASERLQHADLCSVVDAGTENPPGVGDHHAHADGMLSTRVLEIGQPA
jgi:hypothetical protein